MSASSVGLGIGKSGAAVESDGEWRVLHMSEALHGRNGNSDVMFENEGERRALLLRMGTHPGAWVYLDTLARAVGMPQNALRLKLEALEREGLVASERAPAGPRYRLTDDGRRVRAG